MPRMRHCFRPESRNAASRNGGIVDRDRSKCRERRQEGVPQVNTKRCRWKSRGHPEVLLVFWSLKTRGAGTAHATPLNSGSAHRLVDLADHHTAGALENSTIREATPP
jgi:hypothetical protein